VNKKYFTLGQKLVDFGICDAGGTRKMNVTVANTCEKPISIAIHSIKRNWKTRENPFLLPSTIQIAGLSRTDFIVEFRPTFDLQFEEVFSLEYRGQKQKLTIIGSGVAVHKSQIIGTESQDLEFPACEVGRVKRGRLRVNNRSGQLATVTATAAEPFLCPIPSFSVNPNCYVLFPVHFAPKKPGTASAVLRFKSDCTPPFRVTLHGTAFHSLD
jgi:hypothetical protein